MSRYRKKPVVIDAFKFEPKKGMREPDWFLKEIGNSVVADSSHMETRWYIETLEGRMEISKGDYVIKGVQGELYPCKPDIFHATYEKVETRDD